MERSVLKRSSKSSKKKRRRFRIGAPKVYRANSQVSFNRYFKGAEGKDLIVAEKSEWPAGILSTFVTKEHKKPDLLVLQPLRPDVKMALEAAFRRVVDGSVTCIVPKDELIKILTADNRKDLIIGASYIEESNVLLFVRGDLTRIVVPLSWFIKNPDGPDPDPNDLSIEDYGQTVRLGKYEASTDAILYEHDPVYRKAARKNLINNDESLGGSIRRLRLQRGLTQSDFPGITQKTIGRIERGDVQEPHPATLQKIASHLDVTVDDLYTF